ncbi:membrane-bound transcription factor site-2 protease-like [Nilaparvata lugens]|uniref:membrane-bound transcription factor site-2 protease-like n=1 Tax=Nilaparvata lugens TaxID=108931 RepID=UPI000B988D20|nr:membrane-bound transcription factor site-2 protease-like [Nilaparvata lugens]
MDGLYLPLFAFVIFHCSLYLFDTIFKSCLFLPYLHLLKNTGLVIQPFRLVWFTTAFNRLIQKWGSVRPRLLTAWFTVGTWTAMALLPYAVWLLLHSVFQLTKQAIRDDGSPSSDSVILQPVVPGVNLPITDLGYYMITLLFSTVIHEMGHAIAAVREDAHIAGVGAMLVLVVPVAYVSIEQLETLSPVKQLRILCAGIWHNVVLIIAASLALFLLPWVVYPLYDHGTGVQVQSLDKGSPVTGPTGLLVGDRIIQLNQCQVTNVHDWLSCLVTSFREPSPGFCISAEFIKEHDESIPAKHMSSGAVECCASNNPRHLCFEYLESESEPLQLPQHSCLNARTVVEAAQQLCHKPASSEANPECGFNYHCFRPSLENNTKLVLLKRANGREVLFLGHPSDIYHTVHVTDFISVYSIFPSILPEMFAQLCRFLIMFSAGFAVINVIPCFAFDGQNITRALMDLLLSKTVSHASVRHAIALCITIAGTFLVGLYLTLAVWIML